MEREQLTDLLTVSLTRRDKKLLARLAYEQGATMSGLIRRLIREAARTTQLPASTPAKENNSDAR
jgi:hypothetical protein